VYSYADYVSLNVFPSASPNLFTSFLPLLLSMQLDETRALMILLIVTALHGLLAVFLKVYFYR
jgi:hypothetical protein